MREFDAGFVARLTALTEALAADDREQLFAALTAHLDALYQRSPLAISLNIQEFHPVLNFKKNNLHEYVRKRGGAPG